MDENSDPAHAAPSRAGFLKRLSVNEWLTFLVGLSSLVVGVGSLVVSYQSYIASQDNRDIRKAITNLAVLAQQTKRQADSSDQQLEVLKEQALDQRQQTKAISDQTVAITGSATATVKSAQAQIIASDLARGAQAPRPVLQSLSLTGFGEKPNADGLVELTYKWELANRGGALTVKDFGFSMLAGLDLPLEMPKIAMSPGNDIVVTSALNSGFSTTESLKVYFPKTFIDAINSKKLYMFFYGRISYTDVSGRVHIQCFGYRLTIKDGQSVYFAPAGGPNYHCAT